MTYHIYDTNEFTQEVEIVSADYEQEMLLSYSDYSDPDQEDDFREYAEEAVKAKFGVDAILLWE